MFTSLTNRKAHPSQTHGFALVIALSLMAFVLVLLLSITTLVQVESRSSDTSKRTMEARLNAQLAMQVAIGELQRTMGPDTRVSANASILDSVPATAEIDDVQHTHWLGVYPTVNPKDVDGSLLNPKALRDWSLGKVEWLVSKEAGSTLDPSVTLNAADAVTLAQFIDDATTDLPDFDGIENLSASSLSKAQAELVEVDGGAEANSSGRFAWWVGDESMKARVNTQASESGEDVLAGTEIDANQQQRSNYQVTQGTDFSTWLPGYADDLQILDKILAPTGLELIANSSGNTEWAKWGALNRDKFTPYSQSLPVDVVNGRLKQDLTAYFKGTYTGLDGESMIDDLFAVSAPRQPTFDLLKQWSGMVSDIEVPQAVIAPNLNASPAKHGLYPLVTQGSVALRLAYQPIGVVPLANSLNGVFMFQPQIQLWNPHNVRLAAQDYIVQIGTQFDFWVTPTKGSVAQFNFSDNVPRFRSSDGGVQVQSPPVHEIATNDSINYQENPPDALEPRFFTFVIKAQAFEAGETLVFYPKPPQLTPTTVSGVPYNLSAGADIDILENYSDDEDLNLLINEGSLDEFFYVVNPSVWTLESTSPFIIGGEDLIAETNFLSKGLTWLDNQDIYLNLYAADQAGNALLLHALKQKQTNSRQNSGSKIIYPLSEYRSGLVRASDTMSKDDALINIGSSLLASNFDIFAGGDNLNQPPESGQPHAMLGYWNVRNQESFSISDDWATGQTGQDWLNAFSFRVIERFETTWETADNLYQNWSTDRLGGWWISNIQDMAYPFFDYPTGAYGPLSLGEFQHANLSVYSWQPTFAFGNAQAAPRLQRDEYKSSIYEDLYDVSYLLNTSTWDRFYLSSIPQSDELSPGMRLPNSRQSLSYEMQELGLSSDEIKNDSGFGLSAASVVIDGGFNVNSTSITAWEAFISGAVGQSIDTRHDEDTTFTTYDIGPSNVVTAAPIGRFLAPILEEPSGVTADRTTTDFETPQAWASTRTLNQEEIKALATKIVEEVKWRGPFLSLADFVNRRIEPDAVVADEQTYQQLLGTLQAAINKVTLKDELINAHYYKTHEAGSHVMAIKPVNDWVWPDGNFSVADAAQEAMFGYPKSIIDTKGGLIHNYAPNFLSQADVLTKIGPSITVRGDTYVIRSYGDSRNRVTDEVIAEAWCEAVVQRVAEPVDWDGSYAQLIQTQALDDTQPGFGRRFKLLSFRWLNKEDIQPFSNDLAISR